MKCCDCDSTFTSATKLLQHFAEHVLQERKSRFKETFASRSKKKKKDEVRTSQGESSSDCSQTLSASDSSESRESVSPQPCKLAKFDLQKRLENCVSNLTTNNDTNVSIKQEEDECDISNSIPDTKASDDYSPLKFCMITMEENDKKSVNTNPKKIASRKQPSPKKIERKGKEGLRKLAPKPEGLVSPEPAVISSGKKKYACHLCTKVFGWSTDLKRHILVHTGERPFKCKTCHATFTRNFLLQKHQSKVHPCKPKETVVKTEIIEIQNYVENENNNEEVKVEVDPLKEEPMDSNEYEDDEDDDRLIITEDIEEKPSLTSSSDDTKWHLFPKNADYRCSDVKQSEIYSIAPVKV